MKPFSLAIVGRPNVGKSRLINRLAGRQVALVHDQPGVTRDWRETEASWGGVPILLYDTPGLEEADRASLEGRMRARAEAAIERADRVLFVYDARAGLTPYDELFADWLRTTGKPVTLLANKAEGRAGAAGIAEGYALGLGEPLPISAEHNEGISALISDLMLEAKAAQSAVETDSEAQVEAFEGGDEALVETPEDRGPLSIAIVGRPNAGKSTFINSLIGQDRMLTGPEAGITRDAIRIPFDWRGKSYELIDTAGLRRKARIQATLEKMSAGDTLRALRFAGLVVLMVDATEALEKQDLSIGRHVIEEGRGLVVAANKWDLVEDPQRLRRAIEQRLDLTLPQVRGVPLITLSALRGKNVDRVMQAVEDVYGLWSKRLPTAALNRWLRAEIERHPPPMARGSRIKIRYMSQVKARPPTFVLFGTRLDALPVAYERFLINGLRDAFDLWATPIRLLKRSPRNPYDPKGED